MKASNLNRDETIKEIRRINRNLKRRVQRIEADDSLPQFAVESYKGFVKRNNLSNIKKQSDEKLRTMLRDIKYINSLRSSTLKGALRTKEMYVPVKNLMEQLSKEKQKQVWEIYNKLFQNTGGASEFFKYEILNADIEYIYGAEDVEKAVDELMKTFDFVYRTYNGDYEHESARVLFTKKADEFRKQF